MIEIIIGGGFVGDGFLAKATLMDNEKAFFACVFDSDWRHQSMAIAATVAGILMIEMLGIKAVAAMIAATAATVFGIVMAAIFTDKRVIYFDKIRHGFLDVT